MHSGILQKHHTGILTTLQVNELSLHLPLTFSLGNCHMFPFIFKTFNQVFSHFRHRISKSRVKRIWSLNKIPRHLLSQKAHNHMNSVVAERA